MSLNSIIEENMSDFFYTIGKTKFSNFRFLIQDRIKWIFTGIPNFNMVYGAKLQESNIDEEIERVKNNIFFAKSIFSWIITPSMTPSCVSDHLHRKNFKHTGTLYGMYHDLTGIDNIEYNKAIHVEQIGKKNFIKWLEIVIDIYFKSHYNETKKLFETLFFSKHSSFNLYLASYNEQHVGTGAIFYSKNTRGAGIYWIGTDLSHRGKGIGTAIMVKILKDIKNSYSPYVILQSSGDAHSLYKKIGFQDCFEEQIYTWIPGNQT